MLEPRQVLLDLIRQVNWLVIAADPRRAAQTDQEGTRTAPSSRPPGGGGAQAEAARRLLDRSLRRLRSETRSIAGWLEDPSYVPEGRGAKRRCASCHRGLAPGWQFCPGCGESGNKPAA